MARYMNGMANGGSVKLWNKEVGDGLSDHDLLTHVPAIFASEAHESRSDRFVPIPTINIVNGMRNEGFKPVFAQQGRSRIPGKSDFTKHLIRFRHDSLTNTEGETFEVILVNGNDGTSAYKLMAGVFRFLCMNGLFTGDLYGSVNVRHTGSALDDVIEGSYSVLDQAPRVMARVNEFKGLQLDEWQQNLLAITAHELRYPDSYGDKPKQAPIMSSSLLTPRRYGDQGKDLYSMFNVVQENVIKGGQYAPRITEDGRFIRSRTRAVRAIDTSRKINSSLWSCAEDIFGAA